MKSKLGIICTTAFMALSVYAGLKYLYNPVSVSPRLPNKIYTAAHLLPQFEEESLLFDEDKDLMVINASEVLKVEDLHEVYIPTLGRVKVLEYSDEYFIIDALGLVYDGLSGTRVLTPDFRFDVGFVSRLEMGKVYIVRTLEF